MRENVIALNGDFLIVLHVGDPCYLLAFKILATTILCDQSNQFIHPLSGIDILPQRGSVGQERRCRNGGYL